MSEEIKDLEVKQTDCARLKGLKESINLAVDKLLNSWKLSLFVK